jgi:hypothetical protein
MLAMIVLHACGGNDSPTAPTQTPEPTPTPTAPAPQPPSMTITVNVTSGSTMSRGNVVQPGGPTIAVEISGQITVDLIGGGQALDSVSVMVEGQTFDGTPFDATVPFGQVNGSETQPFAFPAPGRPPFPLPEMLLTDVVVSGSGTDPASGATVTQTNAPIDLGPDQVDTLFPPPCLPLDTRACLLGQRFQVEAMFTEGGAMDMPARVFASGAVDPAVDDVLFSFSFADRPVLRVVVSDTCDDNDHFGVSIEQLTELDPTTGPLTPGWAVMVTDAAAGVAAAFEHRNAAIADAFFGPMTFSTCAP